MGLAVVNTQTCLPHVGERDCQLCYEECVAAGYGAIEMKEIPLEIGDIAEGTLSAFELEEAGSILAPVVNAEACVGCGLCEYRCHTVWSQQQHELKGSAIQVIPENEDRF